MSLRSVATALLLFLAPPVSEVLAQARGPGRSMESLRTRAEATHRVETARMDQWLKRFAGQFDVSVVYRGESTVAVCTSWDSASRAAQCMSESTILVPPSPTSKGEGACSHIGAGSGVICLFNAGGARIPRTPYALLLGLDPAIPRSVCSRSERERRMGSAQLLVTR